ncbi:hypothetical protein OERS_39480 [Oerskovia enterophila]|uniref:Uncharacterized protein n=1 Tax=Oerskovia enterophila TaxID=43678 RepID=A0ABX2XYG8_9CELL|nr:hypothetical protein OERS_39480 [Oerskovia enterophila]
MGGTGAPPSGPASSAGRSPATSGATFVESSTLTTIATTMRTSAWRAPMASAAMPSSGGAASEAMDENAETTETRLAACMGSSEAAAIPIGTASAAPRPHATTPTPARARFGANPKSSRPPIEATPETRSTVTRP